MEAGKFGLTYPTWEFTMDEFLAKLGLPQDANTVHVHFGDGGRVVVVGNAVRPQRPQPAATREDQP